MKAYERFLNYVKIDTPSCDASDSVPSSKCQFDLAKKLVKELKELGIDNAECDDKCYVYAYISATKGCENAPSIGFIAHVDTVEDFPSTGIKPRIIENYDGKDIELGCGRVLKTSEFPHLKTFKGRTIITASGDTILGADDKAGAAEIITLCEKLISGKIPHGKICIGFTPDEEIGRGPDYFDVKRFGADFAYTVDGNPEGEVVYENFNAAQATITINGCNIHPGTSKDKMINAALVACELNSMLPSGDTPRNTERYEGFFHLTEMSGKVSEAKMKYIIRDHSAECFKSRITTFKHIEKVLNEKYGDGTVVIDIKEQYRNMAEKIEPCMHIVNSAIQATVDAGVEPVIEPIRGGTDGARLSFVGLPCPNLGTGGFACHGPYEHVSVEGMDKVVEILLNIVEHYAQTK